MCCVCVNQMLFTSFEVKKRELINELNFYGLETFVLCQCMCGGVCDVVCVGVCVNNMQLKIEKRIL